MLHELHRGLGHGQVRQEAHGTLAQKLLMLLMMVQGFLQMEVAQGSWGYSILRAYDIRRSWGFSLGYIYVHTHIWRLS